MMLLVLAAQAAASPAGRTEGDNPFLRSDFDLQRVVPASNEIVVTARREDQRLPPLPPSEESLPRAETGVIGNLRAGIAAERNVLPGGVVSNRLMMNLKLPF